MKPVRYVESTRAFDAELLEPSRGPELVGCPDAQRTVTVTRAKLRIHRPKRPPEIVAGIIHRDDLEPLLDAIQTSWTEAPRTESAYFEGREQYDSAATQPYYMEAKSE